jgi:hypothetical protein
MFCLTVKVVLQNFKVTMPTPSVVVTLGTISEYEPGEPGGYIFGDIMQK